MLNWKKGNYFDLLTFYISVECVYFTVTFKRNHLKKRDIKHKAQGPESTHKRLQSR